MLLHRWEWAHARLVEYSTEPIPETTKVINPQYPQIVGKLRSATAKLYKRMQEFAAVHLGDTIETEQVDQYEHTKSELQQQIGLLQQEIQQLKDNRKNVARHITVKELPPEEQFDRLRVASKHLVDTIKMIAYRAETALASTIKEYLADKEDARMMIKRVCTSKS
jgi:uncharacterized small protein (DUF1192 family)